MLKDYAFGLDTHVSHLDYFETRQGGEEVAKNVWRLETYVVA